jgi:site-specific recombinase XerD
MIATGTPPYSHRQRLICPETSPAARISLGELVAAYGAHLEHSPLSPSTRVVYGRQAHRYLEWLATRPDDADRALSDPYERDFAVRDYRAALKERRLSPASVNSALSAIDHLYRFLRLGPPNIRRESLPAQAPRALSEVELRSVLRAAERRGQARDRATIGLMSFAGLRIGEIAGLDVADIALSARKGHVIVRRGKGDVSRRIPLSAPARELVDG